MHNQATRILTPLSPHTQKQQQKNNNKQKKLTGQTISEGGFAANRVAAASLLEVNETTDKKGKKYYEYSILNRTADGDEGGRHQIIKATVANGKLYIIKAQCGDKRWFKGVKNEVMGSINSFTVA